MREALPTELLLRLLNATPEQYAAVERVLGMGDGVLGLGHGTNATEGTNDKLSTLHPGAIQQSVRHTSSGLRPPSPQSGEGISPIEAERGTSRAGDFEDVARSAFALVQKLDVDAPMKAPSVLTVFRLYCVEGNSAERVARKCRCGKATVIRRLQFIEARTGVKAEQFRAMSGHLQQVDEELNASGAREIYRRGLDGSPTDHGYEED